MNGYNVLSMIFYYSESYPVGAPARTVGWRDLGFTHTSFLTNLWPNTVYVFNLFLDIEVL